MAEINPSFLLPELRLTIGDTNSDSYRYTNEWLEIALQVAVKFLARWWDKKYLINDANGFIYRNPYYVFAFAEPPIVLQEDERPIVLVAAINILRGSLQDVSWNVGSWRDAEIAFSNIESGRIKSSTVKDLWDELLGIMKPPTHKLAWAIKKSLPGFHENRFETSKE